MWYHLKMELKLVNKISESSNTKSFFFEPKNKIEWIPGQYIYITIPKLNYEDKRGNIRHFTISSSPTEGNLIRITIKMRQESGYKKTLDELPIGSILEGKGPMELFLINKSIKKNVFLAGGVGVTPFRSMIKYNTDLNLKIPMHLVYSNSNEEYIFKKEFEKIKGKHSYIDTTYINSTISGRLDNKKLSSILNVNNVDMFWVVGPNPFVDAMEEILEQLNIPSDKILTEKFTGY